MSNINEDIVVLLGHSEDKKHALMTWTTRSIYQLSDLRDVSIQSLLSNLINLFKFLSNLEDEELFTSYYINSNISQLLTTSLAKLKEEHPGKIYDTGLFLSNILSEENPSESKQLKQSKSSKKKTFNHSGIKMLSLVCLIQLFESFGSELNSLVCSIFSSILKNIKKLLDKSKYFHATFITLLFQLIYAILRNGGHLVIDDRHMLKFIKYSKQILSELYSREFDYPVDCTCAMIQSWRFYYTSESFTRHHSNDILNNFKANVSHNLLITYGFSHTEIRVDTAKFLAEVLFYYYKEFKSVTLEKIWIFYSDFFVSNNVRSIKSGCFESIVEFIMLNLSVKDDFLKNDNYLKIIRTLLGGILKQDYIKEQKLDQIFRTFNYFDGLHRLVLPYIGDASKTLILFQIFDKNENILEINPNGMCYETIVFFNLSNCLLSDLSSSFSSDDSIVQNIKSRLISFAVSDNFQLRIHANEVLKTFLLSFPEYITEVIEQSMNALSNNFNALDSFHFGPNHGHALIIANLMSIADKDYVSYELIMKITVFASSFLKQNPVFTMSIVYHKVLICWILLCGLMSYDDEQFLQMHTSQLFLFWKIILTHSFNYSNADELYKNLEVRNHALTCLLNYLSNITIDYDIAKQVSYLLTKCSNFNYSVSLKSQAIDNSLLHNENRILQIYLKIHSYIKHEFNSTVLILVLKNFADPSLYSESLSSVIQSIKTLGDKKKQVKTSDQDEQISLNNLLSSDDGFAYGLSSKKCGYIVDELSIKYNHKIEISKPPEWLCNDQYWYNIFEREVSQPIISTLSYDYFIMLYGNGSYSTLNKYSPKMTTSIINSSIEIFSLIFPYLNPKIQHSVYESLNSYMLSKATNIHRSLAISVNTYIAIHGALKVINRNNLPLDESIGRLLIHSLTRVDSNIDQFLIRLNSDSIGMVVAAVTSHDMESNLFSNEVTHILVKNILDIDNPFSRISNASSLAYIYKYNPRNLYFKEWFSLLKNLLMDPHAVVHCWSLNALSVLLENHLVIDLVTASQTIILLENLITDDSYGKFGNSTWRFNYNHRFNSHLIICQIIKILTEIIGPNITGLEDRALESYKNIIFCMLLSNDIIKRIYAIQIFEHLATFKMAESFGLKFCINISKSIIHSSLFIGIGSNLFSLVTLSTQENFQLTSSIKGLNVTLNFLTKLIKLNKHEYFILNIEYLIWTCLILYPTNPLIHLYINEWLNHTVNNDPNWFSKLYKLFYLSQDILFIKFRQTLVSTTKPLLKDVEKFYGEEEEYIARPNTCDAISQVDNQMNNETIPWRTKEMLILFIKQLLIHSNADKTLSSLLMHRISDLIKISFSTFTIRICSMKLLGIELLGIIIEKFSKTKNSENIESFVFEEQEAQITSSLMPAFDKGTSPAVVYAAIGVAAEFIAANILPLKRLNRVSNLLINALGEFAEKSGQVHIGNAIIPTKKAKRKVELAVLNAWAELQIRSTVDKNEELSKFINDYIEILVPLWIISLREFAMVRYDQHYSSKSLKDNVDDTLIETRNTKLELFKPFWLNFIDALGCAIDADGKLLENCLNKDDLKSFIFILFVQCVEALVKHPDDNILKSKILRALHKVLKSNILSETFFEDTIHTETIDILDRLVLTGSTGETLIVIDIIQDFIISYITQNSEQDKFMNGLDKLYEFLRILMTIVSTKLPFIKDNLMQEITNNKVLLDSKELYLLKKCFNTISTTVSRLPTIFKIDLYSCLLYIIGKIFESNDPNDLVPITLPLLKSILDDLLIQEKTPHLAIIWFESIKPHIFQKLKPENALATCLLFVTSNYPKFLQEEIQRISSLLITCLQNTETLPIAIQGFKTIIMNMDNSNIAKLLAKQIIIQLLSLVNDPDNIEMIEDKRIMGELIFLFTRKTLEMNVQNHNSSFTIALTFFDWFSRSFPYYQSYITERLMQLAEIDAIAFKNTINDVLSEDQATNIEGLLLYGTDDSDKGQIDSHIRLKSFD